MSPSGSMKREPACQSDLAQGGQGADEAGGDGERSSYLNEQRLDVVGVRHGDRRSSRQQADGTIA